jgi:hypothetical protein
MGFIPTGPQNGSSPRKYRGKRFPVKAHDPIFHQTSKAIPKTNNLRIPKGQR